MLYLSPVLCDDLKGLDGGMGGGKEAQEEGNVYIHIADSHRTAESNNIIKQLYSNLKKKRPRPMSSSDSSDSSLLASTF